MYTIIASNDTVVACNLRDKFNTYIIYSLDRQRLRCHKRIYNNEDKMISIKTIVAVRI